MRTSTFIAGLLAVFPSLSPWLALADDAPSASDFLRRVFCTVMVIGDYLYIDGGEVSHLYSGQSGPADYPSYPVNSTLSIPLSTAWTNATVTFKRTPKPAPAPRLSDQAAWRDPSGTSFYVWGGVTSYYAPAPPTEIWHFSVDGSGGGAWSPASTATAASLALVRAIRTTHGLWAQSRDVGYYHGGYGDPNSDQSIINGTFVPPGLLAFNMSSNTLTNSSSTGLRLGMSETGGLVAGVAEFLPYGKNGTLLFMGGGLAPLVTAYAGWSGVSFGSVALYDLDSRKWHEQQTTGSLPSPRERFCSVGVPGPNKTYEIFMYGGQKYAGFATTDEIYVLSLPGFVFFRASGNSTPRADHACALVGRSQMLSVGGTIGSLGFPGSLTDRDPWTHGIGVLDLPRMAWTDRYNPAAGPYESPLAVREWYAQGGLASVMWSSPEVKSLFVEEAPPGSPPSDPSPTPSSETPPPESSGTPVGAIVGGVVGGVFALAAPALAAFFYRRRRQRGSQQDAVALPELDATRHKTNVDSEEYGYYGSSPPQELDVNEPRELPASHGRSEVDAPHGKSELPSNGPPMGALR